MLLLPCYLCHIQNSTNPLLPRSIITIFIQPTGGSACKFGPRSGATVHAQSPAADINLGGAFDKTQRRQSGAKVGLVVADLLQQMDAIRKQFRQKRLGSATATESLNQFTPEHWWETVSLYQPVSGPARLCTDNSRCLFPSLSPRALTRRYRRCRCSRNSKGGFH